MHHITITKLAALSKDHRRYETEKNHIIQTVTSQDNPVKKLRILLEAFEVHSIVAPESISTPNIGRYLE